MYIELLRKLISKIISSSFLILVEEVRVKRAKSKYLYLNYFFLSFCLSFPDVYF